MCSIDIQANVGLGVRRLSIIDLRGGSQPIYNEDRTIRTVYNGEIYNFRELRQKLKRMGHVFSTHCDTEVIVHAYEQYGSNFPRHLNGMFAFALHDSAKRKLILARDHLGIKPLYYAVTPQYLVWQLVFGLHRRAPSARALSRRQCSSVDHSSLRVDDPIHRQDGQGRARPRNQRGAADPEGNDRSRDDRLDRGYRPSHTSGRRGAPPCRNRAACGRDRDRDRRRRRSRLGRCP